MSKKPVKSYSCASLNGKITVPGDKSISHRSLIIASQAIGTSKITGMLEGEDVINTAKALRSFGVDINKQKDIWLVKGVGVGGLQKSDEIIDVGNSGTGARLLMGLMASYPFDTVFTGDASLRSRPMGRVIRPLEKMGVSFASTEGGKMPLTIKGTKNILPIEYELDVPSAQVKSAIILAGLNCAGKTIVIEPRATRDHTELMLKGFGADIKVEQLANGAKKISMQGYPELVAQDISVPGDPSSAAFLVVAALIVSDSEIVIENICVNPLRVGLYETLIEMGADIQYENMRNIAGEQVADLRVKSSKLKGIKVPAERAPSMIDEYPILAVAASCAAGETLMEGLEELRVKESDRLSAIANGLKSCGVQLEEGKESLLVKGGKISGGAEIKTHMDHRIAMSFLILGMVAEKPIIVDDSEMIGTSFPGFIELVNQVGGKLQNAN